MRIDALLVGALFVIIAAQSVGLVLLARIVQRQYHEQMTARIVELTEHRADLDRERRAVHDFYRDALERIGNTVQFGTPTPGPAVVDAEPTPEQALGRAISEDTIARGIETLRREYEAAGIAITEEELRNEVVMIVTGQPLDEPASVKGLVQP